MLLKKHSFLIFLSFIFGLISCNVEEEDTKEKFIWDYSNSTTLTVTSYSSPVYEIKFNKTNLHIKGLPNTQDSLVINLGNLNGDELKVGTYEFGFSNFFNLSFYQNGVKKDAESGQIEITYINNRIDFNFDVVLSDGNLLKSGLGSNLNLYQKGSTVDPIDPEPGVTEIGTIIATLDGIVNNWESTDTDANFLNTSNTVSLYGSNAINTISMVLYNISSIEDLKNKVGNSYDLSTVNASLNYTLTSSSKSYFANSGTLKVISYKDNILSLSFNGELQNVLDNTDKITITNGSVNSIKVN